MNPNVLSTGRDYRIICGDCLDVLARMERGRARLIFADPPYNLGIDYGNGTAADRLPDGEYFDWTCRWINACGPVLTDDGSIWVMAPHEWQAVIWVLLRDAGLWWRDSITWYESFGVNCVRKFGRTSRLIHHFTRNPRKFVFNADAVRVPSARQTLYNDRRARPDGKVPPDVWDIPRVCGTHKERLPGRQRCGPTQLPLELVRRVVTVASEKGDLVLDPFSGSATTGVAALELKRRYVGIELNPDYCRRSADRLAVKGTMP